ncbi:MAG: dynamin family protein [Pleurocapsa sp. MO_226.B13]|nr:dynamin family protein [Pleurocapsa sp. MO_226.B13]
MPQYNHLVNQLRSLLGILELDRESQLYQDTVAICGYLTSDVYRIAVFAPFNHGKSTLLNALLGSKTLPIDLIPTTGAAICVGYGEELHTVISLKDGTKIEQEGIEVLKQYAILDDDRRMKEEVVEVKVTCNHPWLKTGIEFLDLPGTNDREAQNDLVRHKLLSADLIIQVLDARKLMTLEERENLKNWLSNRGISTVIFVVNFLNLLTAEERQAVKKRLYFVAESFRSNLPQGISNLYCVDALPALRARIKGNLAAAQTTGITDLETALQTIASLHRQEQVRLPRVLQITQQLISKAISKQQQLQQEIAEQQQKSEQQIIVKQKAEQLIQQGFDRSISDFRGWLYLPKLLTDYQASLAIALQQTRFDRWFELEFQPNLFSYKQAINKWVNQGCEFFQHDNPQLLEIGFSQPPIIEIPQYPAESRSNNTKFKSFIPQELNFMLKNKAGAVVLGGASYVLNKMTAKSKLTDNYSELKSTKISSQVYADAAATYLKNFSDRTDRVLNQYEKIAGEYITFTPPAIQTKTTATDYQLQLLNNLISSLESELSSIESKIY